MNREQRERHEQEKQTIHTFAIFAYFTVKIQGTLPLRQLRMETGGELLGTLPFLFALFARFAVRFIADTPF